MADPAIKNDRHYTYAEYRSWPDDERWELIDGVAYSMSPAPTRTHQGFVVELVRQIQNQLDDKPCRLYVAPFDVRLPTASEADEQTDTVVQPDIAVICDPSKLDEKGCRGAPDWIIEILSPFTSRKDMAVKFELYRRHGVREYWIVEPGSKYVQVYVLDGLTIDLKRVFVE